MTAQIVFAGLNNEPPPVEFIKACLCTLPKGTSLAAFGTAVEGEFDHWDNLCVIQGSSARAESLDDHGRRQLPAAAQEFLDRFGNEKFETTESTRAWYFYMWLPLH